MRRQRGLAHLKMADVFWNKTVHEVADSRAIGFGRLMQSKMSFFPWLRRRIAGDFDGSILLHAFTGFGRLLLSLRVRSYGILMLSSALFTALLDLLRGFFLNSASDSARYIFCGILILSSCPLLLGGRESLSEALQKSRIGRFLLFDLLGLYPNSLRVEETRAGSGFMLLVGLLLGFLTVFVEPVKLLLFLLALPAVSVIFLRPESGLIMTVLLLPFSTARLPEIAMGLTALGFLLKTVRGKRSIRVGLSEAALLLYGAFLLVGWLLPVSRTAVFGEGFFRVALLLAGVFASQMIRTGEDVCRLVRAFSVTTVLTALFGVAEFASRAIPSLITTGHFAFAHNELTAGFGSPAICGCFFMLSVPLILALPETAGREGNERLFKLIGLPLCLGGILLSGELAAFFGALVSLTVYLFVRRKYIRGLLVGILIAALGILVPFGIRYGWPAFDWLAADIPARLSDAWRYLCACLPCLAVGAGSGASAPAGLYHGAFPAAQTLDSGSFPVQLLCENGIIGLLCFSVMLFVFFSLGNHAVRLGRSYRGASLALPERECGYYRDAWLSERLIAGGMAAVAGVLCGGFLLDPLADMSAALGFWIILGATLSLAEQTAKRHTRAILTEEGDRIFIFYGNRRARRRSDREK